MKKSTTFIKPKIVNYFVVEGELTLQTYNAQYYAWGLNRKVLGLFQFGEHMKRITHAARQDDPYADWFLLRVHDGLGQARFHLQRLEKRYAETLNDKINTPRKIVLPDKPATIPLKFISAYGFMAADVIGDYDRVYRLILTAKFSGLTLDKPFTALEQSIKAIIDPALNLPKQWQATGVTREDVKQNTDKAKQACERMGKLPDKILNAELRTPYAPTIKK